MTTDLFTVLRGLDEPTLAIIAAEAELALRVQEALKQAQKGSDDETREDQ